MESKQINFYSYHAGEVPQIKHVENDGEVPVLGFKDSVPVVVVNNKQLKQQSAKTLIVQTDSTSGKKFILVNGKKVEVKEVMKVKKRVIDKPPPPSGVVVINRAAGQQSVVVDKTKSDAKTSTDGLVQTKDVGVQTELIAPKLLVAQSGIERTITEANREIADPEEDDGYIIREDVRMGFGPKCPTPRINYFDEEISTISKICLPYTTSAAHATRKERLMELIKYDYSECGNFDTSGNMPIHKAVIENNVDMVRRQCVALKYRGISINCTNYNGLTPLQLAVLYEANVNIFKVLLHYGADPAIVDRDGNNVIHLAVMQTKTYILDAVLEKINHIPLGAFNYDGFTPLMLCCFNDNKHEMATILLEKHIDANMRDQKSGRTALFHAVEANNADMVRLLLQYNADPKVKNFVGMSAHDAVFEIEDVNNHIVLMILGKDQTLQRKMRGKRKASSALVKKDVGNVLSANSNVKLAIERRYEKCYVNNKIHVKEV